MTAMTPMTRSLRSHVASSLLALVLAPPLAATAADWPRFRGPELNGISSETKLLQTWPEAGPKVLWRVKTGSGFSGISVAGGQVFTMFAVADEEKLVAFDAATGKVVWSKPIDTTYKNEFGDGPRSTPTIDGDLVYALSANGKLHAFATKGGDTVWTRDLAKDHGAVPPGWGVSTEPLVVGPLLLVNAGGPKGRSVVALDKLTGKDAWAAGNDGAGYASPISVTVEGLPPQVLFFTATALTSLNPKTGAEFWTIPWKTDYDVNAASPIFVPPDRVFVSSGYGNGAALLQLSKAESGVAVKDVWRSRVMKNQFSSSIIKDGNLFGFDDRTLKCVDVATGEERWKERGLGHGSLTLADGKLYVLSEQGLLLLVDASGEAMQRHGSIQIFDGKAWTVPTVSGGKLYVRDENELVCLDISA